MKNVFLFQILVFLFCIPLYSQKLQNEKFISVFQDCLIHCSTFYIKPDFTFTYTAKGVMFNEERKGTWKYISNNKIRIFAAKKKEKPIKFLLKQDNGKTVESKIKGKNFRAMKKTLILQNDSICTLDGKSNAEFCFKRVETF
jgi:hypothetical protein